MVSKMVNLLIIGGGIVGLATALEAAQRFPRLRLLVLEKESEMAAHQSSHNSWIGWNTRADQRAVRLLSESHRRLLRLI